jgi:succinate dehydrogenase/fumarate reductase cytochrome b subunit (b558 family)
VPLSVFVVAHLGWQVHALDGPHRYERAMAATPWFDAHPAVAIVFVLLPLAFHALFGLAIARTARPNVQVYTGSRNWRYVAQRLTGIITLVYIAVHLRQTWIARQLGEVSMSDHYGVLVETLSSTAFGLPWRAAFELVGIAAVCFHLSSGLWGFGCTWASRPRARSSVARPSPSDSSACSCSVTRRTSACTSPRERRIVERVLDGSRHGACERGAAV